MHFFSNQAKLWHVGLVVFVVDGHWSKREDRFTGLVHGVNVFLERAEEGWSPSCGARVDLYGVSGIKSPDDTSNIAGNIGWVADADVLN